MKNLMLFSMVLLSLLTSSMDVNDSRGIITHNKSNNIIYCFNLQHDLTKMDSVP